MPTLNSILIPHSLTNVHTSAIPNTIAQRDTFGSLEVLSIIETSTLDSKENIKKLNNGLDVVLKLNPVVFDSKDHEGIKNIPGLVAEEVNEIYPELVKKDEENNIVGINYTKLIPILISSIQELEKKLQDCNCNQST